MTDIYSQPQPTTEGELTDFIGQLHCAVGDCTGHGKTTRRRRDALEGRIRKAVDARDRLGVQRRHEADVARQVADQKKVKA